MLPPWRHRPEAVSRPAEKERARNWEERMQQNSWAQGRPTHGRETSPNRTHNKTQGNHEVRALQQPPNAAHAERAISKHPPSLYKVPTYSTRAGAAPRAPGGARHGGGNRAVNRWAVCATGVGAHQGQTSREGERGIWWTARTARGGRHLGRTETQRGRRWTACGQRCVDSKNSQTTPATTSTSSIRQLLGAADTQTAHHAASSTVPTRQLLGSANAETTPARAPAAAADRK